MTDSQGTTEPFGEPEPEEPSSRTGLIWAIVAGVAVLIGLAVWWFGLRDDTVPVPTESPSASPSATPSPTPTVTVSVTSSPSPTPTASAASFEDINGRWCSTSPNDPPDTCVTVNLPTIVWDGFEDQPMSVYPQNADIDADPSTYDYSGAPNTGGCWLGAVDFWPPVEGAPLMYCPAGADGEGNWEGMAGPADEDRLWPGFQVATDPPYVRADD